eukprot:CAMPEP_0176346812 /NCGR_PEP_ID=MMETSP0126-20121128/6527_1 /TAXON_ID=141414 ORGANISM="Strombidinopsis acuminatum, Strain SPMC142" /NCGR_SAMPLE_ID=MMETSP0126 /ASSEMBLY_ACC=CAM_ASM_000229 /LENGTH=72 /DNA_ID=CAMNT_0017694553 /DNA_START=1945 /DNA_END=2163 /DNA_ORIENTATION=+
MTNKTTNERYAKVARTTSMLSSSIVDDYGTEYGDEYDNEEDGDDEIENESALLGRTSTKNRSTIKSNRNRRN